MKQWLEKGKKFLGFYVSKHSPFSTQFWSNWCCFQTMVKIKFCTTRGHPSETVPRFGRAQQRAGPSTRGSVNERPGPRAPDPTQRDLPPRPPHPRAHLASLVLSRPPRYQATSCPGAKPRSGMHGGRRMSPGKSRPGACPLRGCCGNWRGNGEPRCLPRPGPFTPRRVSLERGIFFTSHTPRPTPRRKAAPPPHARLWLQPRYLPIPAPLRGPSAPSRGRLRRIRTPRLYSQQNQKPPTVLLQKSTTSKMKLTVFSFQRPRY